MLAGETAGVEGEVVLDALLGQDGGAGGHVAHDGYLVEVGVGLLGHRAETGEGRAGTVMERVLPSALTMTPLSASFFMWKWTVEGDFRWTAAPISRTEGG